MTDNVQLDQVQFAIDWLVGKTSWIDIRDWSIVRFLFIILSHVDNSWKYMEKIRTYFCSHSFRPPISWERVEPTTNDVQTHYAKGLPEPEGWYRVPFEEVSNAKDLPLYKGGVFHVTADYATDWYWRNRLSRDCIIRTTQTKHAPGVAELIDYFNGGGGGGKRQRVGGSDDNETRVGSEEHEAPCMQKMLIGAFPGDLPRQYLVRTWSSARVSLEYVKSRLEALNIKYPHSSGPMDLKKRWDYERHYNKRYAPPKCKDLCDYCPFTGTVDQRKSMCLKLLMERFPEKYPVPPQWKFKGPAYWYEW